MLAATGMPGAYKLLIFFLLQEIYGLPLLGNIASWLSIAQIIGFFTAIGWSSLILVRVAKCLTQQERVTAFNRLAMMSGITLVLCIAATMLIGSLIGKGFIAAQISCWLIAWTAYQLPRHYFVALKKYRKALCLDAVLIGLSICTLLLANSATVSIGLSFSMAVAGLTAYFVIQRGSKAWVSGVKYEMKGLEFGLVNFLSGGISLSLIPLAAHLEGEALAGILSLFISVTGIALLVPRAVALNQLPKIAKVIHDSKAVVQHIKVLFRQISISNVITTVACLVVASVMLSQTPTVVVANELMPIFILIILQSTLTTQALIYSNVLMAMEDSRYSLKINFCVSAVFFLAAVIVSLRFIDLSFFHVCLAVVLLNLYRFYKIKQYVKIHHDGRTAI